MRPDAGTERDCDAASAQITMLWSELRGLPPLAGPGDPAQVMAQLNQYFDEMVAAIDAAGGTIDGFRGGSLSASFGAWDDPADHASRACAAASDMVVRLESLNAPRAARGLLPLELGIGIATGTAMLGEIGPEGARRRAVIGAPPALAARLEGASGRLGTSIVLSRATATQLAPDQVHSLGWAEVRGEAEPVQVATLAWLVGTSDADVAETA